MAGCYAYQNTNLSTPNGFYRVESCNLSTFGATLALTASVNVPMTFSNAGNLSRVVLGLWTSFIYSSSFRDVKVDLQENVVGVWTTRNTKTLTAAQITNNGTFSDYLFRNRLSLLMLFL